MVDRLVAGNNPFATPMTLRYWREELNEQALPPFPEATREGVVLIHRLCGDDLQWHAQHKGHGVDHR